MTDDRLLRVYLADHQAGEIVGRELARRCLRANRGTALGGYLEQFLEELDQDTAALDEVTRRLGARADRVKNAAAWITEKAGRLKLNGRLGGYSPLSRLEELEGLSLGVEGKLALWRSLAEIRSDSRLEEIDFEQLAARAGRQRRRLERFRSEAARRAFVEGA
jgi:hypothetical protein